MNFRDYQIAALETDQLSGSGSSDEPAASLVVPILGLAGEVGQLLAEYKKHLRDGPAHSGFKDRVSEELGDLLWYVANVASKFELNLDDIAVRNLAKTTHMWPRGPGGPYRFDHGLPVSETLPRTLLVELVETMTNGRPQVRISMNGEALGSPLSDNAYDPDGYRFHDAFHLGACPSNGFIWGLVGRWRAHTRSWPVVCEL